MLKNKIYSSPNAKERWDQVHIDNAHVKGMELFLILVDSFSGWPEVNKVADRKATTIEQILSSTFSKIGVPKT